LAVYAGKDMQAAQEAIAPLLTLEGYQSHTLEAKQYADVLDEKPYPGDVTIISNNMLIKDADEDFYQLAADCYNVAETPIMFVRYINGAFNRVAEDATAFGGRDSSAIVMIAALIPGKANHAQRRQVKEAWSKLRLYDNGSYVNFLNVSDVEAPSYYSATTYRRLVEAKKRYDPRNIFRRNYNIDPNASLSDK